MKFEYVDWRLLMTVYQKYFSYVLDFLKLLSTKKINFPETRLKKYEISRFVIVGENSSYTLLRNYFWLISCFLDFYDYYQGVEHVRFFVPQFGFLSSQQVIRPSPDLESSKEKTRLMHFFLTCFKEIDVPLKVWTHVSKHTHYQAHSIDRFYTFKERIHISWTFWTNLSSTDIVKNYVLLNQIRFYCYSLMFFCINNKLVFT